jgi:hypothetical protein
MGVNSGISPHHWDIFGLEYICIHLTTNLNYECYYSIENE